MKKVLGICLSFVMALFVLSASAQTQYKGTVVDEQGQPVIGATVVVKGTTIGTTTGVDGEFAIAVPAKGLVQDILLEVNIGREEAKGGFLPEELPALLEQ